MKIIMFVCTGNTCRSPMAEGIANKLINNNVNLKDSFIAKSSGIAATNNQSASYLAIETLKNQWDIDISKHISKNFQTQLDQNFFLILTMTKSHSTHLKTTFPEYKSIIYTLREYISLNSKTKYSNIDILDPFGTDKYYYQKCAKELYNSISILTSILNKL